MHVLYSERVIKLLVPPGVEGRPCMRASRPSCSEEKKAESETDCAENHVNAREVESGLLVLLFRKVVNKIT